MNKIIIGFVGELASGKGCASEYLIKKYKAGYYIFSSPLRETAKKLYLEETRANLQKLSQSLRETFGQDILAKIIAENVKNDKRKIVIADGIRRFPDIRHLSKIHGFKLVYVTASENIRFARIKKRKQYSDDKKNSMAEFKKLQNSEADRLIKTVAKKAKIVIDNNSTKKDLYKKLDQMISKLK
ncbi:AAA family ATPase [Patescibacteria group bacterium]|nr:AAA family ATPase [Patescibacteria group bacterium]